MVLFGWAVLHFWVLLFWCLLIRISCLIYAYGGVAACCAAAGVAGVVLTLCSWLCLCGLLLAIWVWYSAI